MKGIAPPSKEPGRLAQHSFTLDARRAGFVRAGCVLAATLCTCLAARAAPEAAGPPKRLPEVTAVRSAIVQHEERSGSLVLYHEESGGILAPVAPPLERDRRSPLPPLKPGGDGGAGAARARPASPPATGARK